MAGKKEFVNFGKDVDSAVNSILPSSVAGKSHLDILLEGASDRHQLFTTPRKIGPALDFDQYARKRTTEMKWLRTGNAPPIAAASKGIIMGPKPSSSSSSPIAASVLPSDVASTSTVVSPIATSLALSSVLRKAIPEQIQTQSVAVAAGAAPEVPARGELAQQSLAGWQGGGGMGLFRVITEPAVPAVAANATVAMVCQSDSSSSDSSSSSSSISDESDDGEPANNKKTDQRQERLRCSIQLDSSGRATITSSTALLQTSAGDGQTSDQAPVADELSSQQASAVTERAVPVFVAGQTTRDHGSVIDRAPLEAPPAVTQTTSGHKPVVATLEAAAPVAGEKGSGCELVPSTPSSAGVQNLLQNTGRASVSPVTPANSERGDSSSHADVELGVKRLLKRSVKRRNKKLFGDDDEDEGPGPKAKLLRPRSVSSTSAYGSDVSVTHSLRSVCTSSLKKVRARNEAFSRATSSGLQTWITTWSTLRVHGPGIAFNVKHDVVASVAINKHAALEKCLVKQRNALFVVFEHGSHSHIVHECADVIGARCECKVMTKKFVTVKGERGQAGNSSIDRFGVRAYFVEKVRACEMRCTFAYVDGRTYSTDGIDVSLGTVSADYIIVVFLVYQYVSFRVL